MTALTMRAARETVGREGLLEWEWRGKSAAVFSKDQGREDSRKKFRRILKRPVCRFHIRIPCRRSQEYASAQIVREVAQGSSEKKRSWGPGGPTLTPLPKSRAK